MRLTVQALLFMTLCLTAGCGSSDKLEGDQTTAKGALRRLISAVKLEDGATARGCLAADTPPRQAYADAMKRLLDACGKLQAAGAERFGSDAGNQLAGTASVVEQSYSPFDAGTLQTVGDEATLTSSDGQVLHLQRINKLWEVIPEGTDLAQAAALMNQTARVLSGVADQVSMQEHIPRLRGSGRTLNLKYRK